MDEVGPDEAKCAKLIRMAMSLGQLGGAVVVDEGYTDEEIRVADETVKREMGPKFAVVRGHIVQIKTNLPMSERFMNSEAVIVRRGET